VSEYDKSQPPESGEAPVAEAGASPSDEVSIPDLQALVETTIRTKDKDIESRREWTRVWLTIAFVILFVVVFGVGVIAAFIGGEVNQNVTEKVNAAFPFVTAFGGYVLSFYFPTSNPPQSTGQGFTGQQN
jgi:hypothetical protein